MSKVEEMLIDKKNELDELIVPEELEARLNNALKSKTVKKKQKNTWAMKIAVLLIAFMLVSYNMDTLAFYGKELLGFDNIMNGTLKDLNKMGMGQTIDKSYTFSNGIKVTLDGVMADDNQLLAFYTIQNPNGSVEHIDLNSAQMRGAIGIHYFESGQGELSNDKTAIRWVGAFEPPYVFEKKLTWTFSVSVNGKHEEGKISFVLDRDKAMGHTLKTRLNKSIKAKGVNIKFDTITASPTTTIVKGTIQDIVELAIDKISGERMYAPILDLRLIADGKEIESKGSSVSTGMKGMKFEARYDALPRDLKKLQLHLVSFKADYDMYQLISLSKTLTSQTEVVEGQDIIIEKVEAVKGETFITITTKDTLVLRSVYLLADNNRVELTETFGSIYDKKADGTVTHTRTLRFNTTAEELQLEIKRMRYEKPCDEYVDIPIE